MSEKIEMKEAEETLVNLDKYITDEDLNPVKNTNYAKIDKILDKSLIVHNFEIQMRKYKDDPERETLVMDFEIEGSGNPQTLTTAAWKLVQFAKHHIERNDLPRKYPFRIKIIVEGVGRKAMYRFERVVRK